MTRDELLRELAASQAEFLAAIDGLGEAEMAQEGAMPGWSPKDLLAHVTAWEAELIKALAQARMGRRPAYAGITPAQEDARNEKWRREFKKKPLAKVLEDYTAVRRQTIRQVTQLSEADLADPRRSAWTGGESLASVIADGTVDHDREHAAQVRQWRLARVQAAQPAEADRQA